MVIKYRDYYRNFIHYSNSDNDDFSATLTDIPSDGGATTFASLNEDGTEIIVLGYLSNYTYRYDISGDSWTRFDGAGAGNVTGPTCYDTRRDIIATIGWDSSEICLYNVACGGDEQRDVTNVHTDIDLDSKNKLH